MQYVQTSTVDGRGGGGGDVYVIFNAEGKESLGSGRCRVVIYECNFYLWFAISAVLVATCHRQTYGTSSAPCSSSVCSPLSGFNVNHEVVKAQSFICRHDFMNVC